MYYGVRKHINKPISHNLVKINNFGKQVIGLNDD